MDSTKCGFCNDDSNEGKPATKCKSKCPNKDMEKLLRRFEKDPSEMSRALSEEAERSVWRMISERKQERKNKKELKEASTEKSDNSEENERTALPTQDDGHKFTVGRQPVMSRLTMSYQKSVKMEATKEEAEKKPNDIVNKSKKELFLPYPLQSSTIEISEGVTKSLIKYPELLLKKNFEVKISHVNSLCDFYVTKTETEIEENSMKHYLSNMMSRTRDPYTLSSFTSGYIGACEVDGQWHRAVLTSFSKKDVGVFLIDCGMKMSIPLVAVVVCPVAVAKKDALAYHCTLNLALEYADAWKTNLESKFNNLHNACAPGYKLTVNADSVENGLHSVTLYTGYQDDYSSSLKKLSFAKDLNMEESSNLDNEYYNGGIDKILDLNLDASDPVEQSDGEKENEESTVDSIVITRDLFKDSLSKLKLHRQKSTKFRIYRTRFGGFTFYIAPEKNDALEIEMKLESFLENGKKNENFIPKEDEVVCIKENRYARVKVIRLSKNKKTFHALHVDSSSSSYGEYKTEEAYELPKHLQIIPPVGFWVCIYRHAHRNALSTDIEKFYEFISTKLFVVTDVMCNYETEECPYVDMRVADGEEHISINGLLNNIERWRYELLLTIGYCTDEHFVEDDKENRLSCNFIDAKSSSLQDHRILEGHMSRFYTIVRPSELSTLSIGQYVAVNIVDEENESLHKWHRSVVEPDNFIQCVDHLEKWKFTTDKSKMIVRPLISEFLKVEPLANSN